MRINKRTQSMLDEIKIQVLSVLNKPLSHSSLSKLKFLQIVHSSILSEIFINKRSIFYSSVPLFKSQNTVNALVEKYSKILQCSQNSLRVKSGLKGLLSGNVVFIFKDDKRQAVKGKALIPDLAEIKEIQHDYNTILVIEKDTIFDKVDQLLHFTDFDCSIGYGDVKRVGWIDRMANNNIIAGDIVASGNIMAGYIDRNEPVAEHIEPVNMMTNNNVTNAPMRFLIICGKGYPCKNTIALLKRLSPTVSNIFCLTDFDPYGFHIFLIYKRSIPKIQRIGLCVEDLFENRINYSECIKLNERDLKMIEKIRKMEDSEKLLEELDFMEGLGMKMELEIVFNHFTV